MKLRDVPNNYNWTKVAREVSSFGYRTIEDIETLPAYDAKNKYGNLDVIRSFPSPFNHAVTVIVVR